MRSPVRAGADRRLLAGIVVGVAVCAALVAVLITGGKLRWTVTAPGTDAGSITLPDAVAGLADYSTALLHRPGRTWAQLRLERAALQRTYTTTAAAYLTAYGGSGVAVRRYASPDLGLVLTVVAVRAGSGPLVAGVLDDPADLGLLAQPREVVAVSGVSCLIRRYLHGPGGDLNPTNQLTDECQLTDSRSAAVWVFVDGADTSGEQQIVIEATTAAFRAVVAQR